MLSVIMLNVMMLSVVAPTILLFIQQYNNELFSTVYITLSLLYKAVVNYIKSLTVENVGICDVWHAAARCQYKYSLEVCF
jgi:hypothetical protein